MILPSISKASTTLLLPAPLGPTSNVTALESSSTACRSDVRPLTSIRRSGTSMVTRTSTGRCYHLLQQVVATPCHTSAWVRAYSAGSAAGVVRRFDRHLDVVRVRFLQAGRGDPDEAALLLQFGHRAGA